MANIKPLEDKVLVQIVEAETTTASGLVIPDSAKEKPQEATVVAVGPGRTNDKGEVVPVGVNEGDTVIFSKYVQIVEAETTTASGLVIPDSAKEKPQEATVVAVGPGRTNDKGEVVPVGVNEGDTVIFSKYGGTELKYDGQEYLLLSARDLLAVIEK